MAEPEIVAALVALGFSLNESRAYRALLLESPATGYEVGVRAQIPRSAVYGVLRRLVAVGAARAIAGTPERFAAAPPQEVLTLLRKRFDGQTGALEEAIRELDATPATPDAFSVRGYAARARGGGAPHRRSAGAPGHQRLAARDRAPRARAEEGGEAARLHRDVLARGAAEAARRGLQLRARSARARGLLEAPSHRRGGRRPHAHRGHRVHGQGRRGRERDARHRRGGDVAGCARHHAAGPAPEAGRPARDGADARPPRREAGHAPRGPSLRARRAHAPRGSIVTWRR